MSYIRTPTHTKVAENSEHYLQICHLSQCSFHCKILSTFEIDAILVPPLPQLNKQECPSWTYLALGDGPQNGPLLATIVYLFKRKIILLKLLVTLKPGYFLLICLSSFHSYQWFWLLFKELYCCIDISSLYLTWLPKSPTITS